ncbi:hypothetical protein J7552_06475 [Wohlfahrtiimonas chitiniclastica]|uniref:hypothetical protein n=1 Tax=Wohlfahrtiimonas chitiniclastica TaxID=400946 RepID=UPI001BCCD1CE|nr:hypothetical protein [Wohlfahrtiimonas chitiniclastica]MBS7820930.1 hypothetical protein [Wohlfahrtiimonas chitiniclastica]
MVLKRSIRLKEFNPSTKFIRIPPNSYYDTRPNLSKNKYYYFHTDEDGFIYNSIEKVYDRDLILIGGSSVENLFVDVDKRVLKYLEEFLFELGLDYNIKNAGTSGASLLHITNMILNKIVIKNNPIIFLFIPSNDSSILNLSHSYWNIDKLNSNLVGIENQTILKKSDKGALFFERMLSTLISICKSFSVELYVFNTIRFKEKPNYKLLDSLAEKICKEQNIIFTNINSLLQYERFFYDDVHLNAEGSYYLATILKKFCVEHIMPTQTNSYRFESGPTQQKLRYLCYDFKSVPQRKIFNINKISVDDNPIGYIYNNSIMSDIVIYSKIYSKYKTYLVFNKNKNCLELTRKIINSEQSVVHIEDGKLFFIDVGIKNYINMVHESCVTFSPTMEINYLIEIQNNGKLSIKVDELYISASNLMNVKYVKHKKACEIFSIH